MAGDRGTLRPASCSSGIGAAGKDGSFEWGPTDALVGAFASHGIRSCPVRVGSPALGGRRHSLAPPLDGPEDVQAWQDFLEAAVARYGPRRHLLGHGLPPALRRRTRRRYPIHSWQVWNEPNLSEVLRARPSPEQYARLLDVSHDAIKRKDPNARIVLAGMPGYGDVNAWDFLDEPLLESRGQGRLRRRGPAPVRAQTSSTSRGRSSESAR